MHQLLTILLVGTLVCPCLASGGVSDDEASSGPATWQGACRLVYLTVQAAEDPTEAVRSLERSGYSRGPGGADLVELVTLAPAALAQRHGCLVYSVAPSGHDPLLGREEDMRVLLAGVGVDLVVVAGPAAGGGRKGVRGLLQSGSADWDNPRRAEKRLVYARNAQLSRLHSKRPSFRERALAHTKVSAREGSSIRGYERPGGPGRRSLLVARGRVFGRFAGDRERALEIHQKKPQKGPAQDLYDDRRARMRKSFGPHRTSGRLGPIEPRPSRGLLGEEEAHGRRMLWDAAKRRQKRMNNEKAAALRNTPPVSPPKSHGLLKKRAANMKGQWTARKADAAREATVWSTQTPTSSGYRPAGRRLLVARNHWRDKFGPKAPPVPREPRPTASELYEQRRHRMRKYSGRASGRVLLWEPDADPEEEYADDSAAYKFRPARLQRSETADDDARERARLGLLDPVPRDGGGGGDEEDEAWRPKRHRPSASEVYDARRQTVRGQGKGRDDAEAPRPRHGRRRGRHGARARGGYFGYDHDPTEDSPSIPRRGGGLGGVADGYDGGGGYVASFRGASGGHGGALLGASDADAGGGGEEGEEDEGALEEDEPPRKYKPTAQEVYSQRRSRQYSRPAKAYDRRAYFASVGEIKTPYDTLYRSAPFQRRSQRHRDAASYGNNYERSASGRTSYGRGHGRRLHSEEEGQVRGGGGGTLRGY